MFLEKQLDKMFQRRSKCFKHFWFGGPNFLTFLVLAKETKIGVQFFCDSQPWCNPSVTLNNGHRAEPIFFHLFFFPAILFSWLFFSIFYLCIIQLSAIFLFIKGFFWAFECCIRVAYNTLTKFIYTLFPSVSEGESKYFTWNNRFSLLLHPIS